MHTLINNKKEGKWLSSLQPTGCYTVRLADLAGVPSHAAPRAVTTREGASAQRKPPTKQQRCPHKGRNKYKRPINESIATNVRTFRCLRQSERKPPACAPCKYSADLQVGAPSKSLAEGEGKTVAGPSGHSRGSDLWHGAAFTLRVCIIYVVTQMLSRSAQCFIETEEKVCSSDTVVNPQSNHSGGRGLEGDLSYLPVSDRFIDVTLWWWISASPSNYLCDMKEQQ